jgi:hypothetical protein
MALKILVPVIASDRFSDAVVAAGDLLAEQGGTVTFLFTTVRPPQQVYDSRASQTESELEVDPAAGGEDGGDPDEGLDGWRDQMIAGLEDARQLLYERGIDDDQINHRFADPDMVPSMAVADEAAMGAYELVILSRGEIIDLAEQLVKPEDVIEAVQELRPDGVRIVVT